MEVTVLVATYNPKFPVLKKTLFSIVNQKEVSFEIVIADDGSKDFPNEEIKSFFNEYKFENYTVTRLETNQGTVCSLNNGISHSKGRYIKIIGQGDFLYDSYTLRDFLHFAEENNSKVVFGNSIYFFEKENEIKIFDKIRQPHSLKPYLNKSIKSQQHNYLIYRDYILGASFFGKTDLLKKYLLLIKNKVTYAEDCSYILMSAFDINFDYFDRNIVWYEYGSGISTTKNKKWEEMLRKDSISTGQIIIERTPKWNVFLDLLVNKKTPKVVFYRLLTKAYYKIPSKRKTSYDIKYLEDILSIV